MPTGSEPRSIVNSGEATKVTGRRDRRSLEARLLRRLLASVGDPPIEFELAWTGERIVPDANQPAEKVRIADRSTLRGLLRDA